MPLQQLPVSKIIAKKDVASTDTAQQTTPPWTVPIDIVPADVAPVDVVPFDVALIDVILRWGRRPSCLSRSACALPKPSSLNDLSPESSLKRPLKSTTGGVPQLSEKNVPYQMNQSYYFYSTSIHIREQLGNFN